MKKHLALFVLAALVLAAPALAEEHAAQAEAQAEVRAGITPASPLYGLATAWERVQLSFVRNPERRAERALSLADKKIAEIEVLAERGEIQRAERAEQRYEELLEQATQAIERLEEADSYEDAQTRLEASSRARANLQVRLERVVETHERILERQADRMSEQQLERLEQAFARANNAALQADARFEESQERVKTRTKVLGNLSDEEADALEANVSARTGLEARLDMRAENILARMEERNQRLLDNTSNRSTVALERLEVVLNQQVERLAENFERRNQRLQERASNRSAELESQLRARHEARVEAAAQVGVSARERAAAEQEVLRERATQRAAQAREQAAQTAEDMREQERPSDGDEPGHLRVAVEIGDTESEVFVQTQEQRTSFTVESTDRQEIARIVANRLEVSYQEVVDVALWSRATTQRPDETRPVHVDDEITVLVRESDALVELNVRGREVRFIVESTNRARIEDQIVMRTGISQQRMEHLIEWMSDSGDTRVDANASVRVGSDVGVNTRARVGTR